MELNQQEAENRSATFPIPVDVTDDIIHKDDDEDLHSLLLPDPSTLPSVPPSAVESNFTRYYVTDFIKPGHDQYIYRHANGLCVIGLAPTHLALKDEGGITTVDFNVGKSDRSEMKATGKRKRNAQQFEPNSALCKVCSDSAFYVVRCCVKGSLLEVNDRLIKQPDLLNSSVWDHPFHGGEYHDGYVVAVMLINAMLVIYICVERLVFVLHATSYFSLLSAFGCSPQSQKATFATIFVTRSLISTFFCNSPNSAQPRGRCINFDNKFDAAEV